VTQKGGREFSGKATRMLLFVEALISDDLRVAEGVDEVDG
jgi:hypothetical protein